MRKLLYLFVFILFCMHDLWAFSAITSKVKSGSSVAIIGGGPSGIHFYRFLRSNGYKVKLFEKKSRPDANFKGHGRALTANLRDLGRPTNEANKGVSDLGAIQIGPGHYYTQQYISELGLEVFEPADSCVIRGGNSHGSHRVLRPHEEFFPYGSRFEIIQEMARYKLFQWDHLSRYPNLEDVPDDEEYTQSYQQFMIQNNFPALHHAAEIYTSAYGYGVAGEITAFKALRLIPAETIFWVSSDQKPKMLKDGFGGFLDKMVNHYKIEINYDQEISSIHRASDGVFISHKNGDSERFDKIIFACPIDKVIKLLEPNVLESELYENLYYSPYATLVVSADNLPRGGGVFADNFNKHGLPQMFSKNSPSDNYAIIYVPLRSSLRAKNFAKEVATLPSLEEIERVTIGYLNELGLGPVKVLFSKRWDDYNPHFDKPHYYRLGAQAQGNDDTFYGGTSLDYIDYVNSAFRKSHELLNYYFEGDFPAPDQSLWSAIKWHRGASNLY